MIQYIKSIPYHIKTAFKSVYRHFAVSISSATAVSVVLVLVSCFLLLALNITSFTSNIEESVKIHVKIESTITEWDQISALQTEIEDVPGVEKVIYSDKDAEMDAFLEYIKNTGGTPSFYEAYQGENNPLRDAFIIEVAFPDQIEIIAKNIRNIEGVEKAEYGGTSANTMITAFDSIRNSGLVAAIALTLLAIFLISNTIRMAIYARADEIAIMRQVGAANWFIKRPFMIEGMIIGFMGSIIPIGLTIYAYKLIYELLGGYFFTQMFSLYPVFPFTLYVSAILLILGMGVGLVGSFFSVNKYLRWKR